MPKGKDCALARPNKGIAAAAAAAAAAGSRAAAAATRSSRSAQPADKQYYQWLEIAVDSGDY